MSSSDENEVVKGLQAILDAQDHLFACGGVIHVHKSRHTTSNPGSPRGTVLDKTKELPTPPVIQSDRTTSDPITIRYDAAAASESSLKSYAKLTLPLEHETDNIITRLIQQSQPATFGRGGEDVYDESYRKAVQMSPNTFCTTFDPYSLGIVDTIAQVLLPSVIDSTSHRAVYSAPSGKFKPHVDTPRSQHQFGSLVVCLPVSHEGGQLQVRHKSQEMTFDWSTNQADPNDATISWAAFYSDCEHEVLEVTSGHRLTLTYNLYAVRGAGRLTGVSPTLDPTKLPLFKAFQATLDQDPFNGQGGTLGFWCSHVYAYNNKRETPLPNTLKGVDAVLWEIFMAMYLPAKIVPVIEMDEDIQYQFSNFYDNADDPENPWAVALRARLPPTKPSKFIIGHQFGIRRTNNIQVESVSDYHSIFTRWGEYAPDSIKWLVKPRMSELQLLYMAYGNNASMEAMYSRCAMLVTIPAKDELSCNEETI